MNEDEKFMEERKIYMEGWECGRKAMISLTLKRIEYLKELHKQTADKWREAKKADNKELKNIYYLKKKKVTASAGWSKGPA